MDNEYARKEKVCPLIGDYCDEEHKDCDRCVAEEDAWQRLQCYIDSHNYDWTLQRIMRMIVKCCLDWRNDI